MLLPFFVSDLIVLTIPITEIGFCIADEIRAAKDGPDFRLWFVMVIVISSPRLVHVRGENRPRRAVPEGVPNDGNGF